MKKNIILPIVSALFVVIVASCLVACNSMTYSSMIDEVKQAFAEKYDLSIDDLYVDCFYGIYDQSFVVNIKSRDSGYFAYITSMTIGGVEFYFNSGDEIYVYNGGELYFADDAFDKGLLTNEDVEVMYSIFSNDNQNYYGCYNGATVKYKETGDKTPQTIKIGEERIKLKYGGKITVEKQGIIYDLKEDTETLYGDVLTDKNLKTINSFNDIRNEIKDLEKQKEETLENLEKYISKKTEKTQSSNGIKFLNQLKEVAENSMDTALNKNDVTWIAKIVKNAANSVPSNLETIESKILQTFIEPLTDLQKETNNIYIKAYLGTYNGTHIVMFANKQSETTEIERTAYGRDDEWDNDSISHITRRNGMAWKGGKNYNIITLYEFGYLSSADLYIASRIALLNN